MISRPEPAQRAGLSFGVPGRNHRVLLVVAIALSILGSAGCGDSEGIWPRYQLQKSLFRAQQSWARAELEPQSGQSADRTLLAQAIDSALAHFDRLRPELGASDTMIFVMAAQAGMRRAELHRADTQWAAALDVYAKLTSDTMFPVHFHNQALFQQGRMHERLGMYLEAAVDYRRLVEAWYPPQAEGGVNREVLDLPLRIASMAEEYAVDSVRAWREFADRYYESLAQQFPGTDLGALSLGQLGRLYAHDERWEDAIATLERARDSAGHIVPAFWIDIAEIRAAQLGDTVGALEIYAAIAERGPESAYRVDADSKTAQIWMRQKRYGEVQSKMVELKDTFEDRPGVVIPCQMLYAQSLAADGNWERARAEFAWLVTNYPRSLQAVEAAMILARRYAQTGETASARGWYNRTDRLALDLGRAGGVQPAVAGKALEMAVQAALAEERWDDAAQRLEMIAQMYTVRTPAGAIAHVRLGWLHLRQRGDTTAAANAWRPFLEQHPEHAQSKTLRDEMNKWPKNRRLDIPS